MRPRAPGPDDVVRWKVWGLLALGAGLSVGIVAGGVSTIFYLFEVYPPLGFAVLTTATCVVARGIVARELSGGDG